MKINMMLVFFQFTFAVSVTTLLDVTKSPVFTASVPRTLVDFVHLEWKSTKILFRQAIVCGLSMNTPMELRLPAFNIAFAEDVFVQCFSMPIKQ